MAEDPQADLRLSMYGEPPTLADIDPDHPLAPALRAVLVWRLATEDERRRIWGGELP